jgi:hypothetical protein
MYAVLACIACIRGAAHRRQSLASNVVSVIILSQIDTPPAIRQPWIVDRSLPRSYKSAGDKPEVDTSLLVLGFDHIISKAASMLGWHVSCLR